MEQELKQYTFSGADNQLLPKSSTRSKPCPREFWTLYAHLQSNIVAKVSFESSNYNPNIVRSILLALLVWISSHFKINSIAFRLLLQQSEHAGDTHYSVVWTARAKHLRTGEVFLTCRRKFGKHVNKWIIIKYLNLVSNQRSSHLCTRTPDLLPLFQFQTLISPPTQGCFTLSSWRVRVHFVILISE